MPFRQAFIFAGTGQDPKKAKHNYGDYCKDFIQAGYHCDEPYLGIGVSASTGKKNLFTSTLGLGWEKSIEAALASVIQNQNLLKMTRSKSVSAKSSRGRGPRAAMAAMAAAAPAPVAAAAGGPPEFVCLGLSRGGVQAIIMANILARKFRGSKIFVGTMDPVAGMNILDIKSHSFDAWYDMAGQNFLFELNQTMTRSDHLMPATFSTYVDKGVTAHSNTLMQFSMKGREFMPFFTPAAPGIGTLKHHPSVSYNEYLMLGKHSDGSRTDPHVPVAVCCRDIFYSDMRKAGFTRVPGRRPLTMWNLLEAYACMVIFDVGQKYSFVKQHAKSKASPNPAASSVSVASSSMPLHSMRGRERLQADPSQEVGIVNKRHQELYAQFARNIYPRVANDMGELKRLTNDRQKMKQKLAGLAPNLRFFPDWFLRINGIEF